MFEKPDLAKNKGHAINTCVEILEEKYTRAKDEAKLKNLIFFVSLMKSWKVDVTRAALRTVDEKTDFSEKNKGDLLSLRKVLERLGMHPEV